MHRYLGVAVTLFVVVLTLTGVALNHSPRLGLADIRLANSLLLQWYGIAAPKRIQAYAVGQRWVSVLDRRVYLDSDEVAAARGLAPVGALELDAALVIAAPDALLLLDAQAQLIERLDAVHGIPTGIEKIGRWENRLAVHTATGSLVADADLLSWSPIDAAQVQWQVAAPPPPALAQALSRAYAGPGLSLERVLLDLHSGRILGRYGIYLVDAAALGLLALALLGLWLWATHPRKSRPS